VWICVGADLGGSCCGVHRCVLPRGGARVGLAAGMVKIRAGAMVLRGAVGVPVTRVFSLYVVQAGSACPRMRAGLPRQRSTELVRSSGRPGGSCPGFPAVGPRRLGGLALPLLREADHHAIPWQHRPKPLPARVRRRSPAWYRYPYPQDVLLAAIGTPSPNYRTRRTSPYQQHLRRTTAPSALSYYYGL
jgi:hypothetical protein